MIFPEDPAQQEAEPEPQPKAEKAAKPKAEAKANGHDQSAAEEPSGETPEAAPEAAPEVEAQAAEPQPPQMPPVDPMLPYKQRMEQLEQQNRIMATWLQQVALSQQRPPQQQSAEPDLTAEKFWEDPLNAAQAVARKTVEQIYRERVAPLEQHYRQSYLQTRQQQVAAQYQELANSPDAKIRADFEKHKEKFDSTVSALLQTGEQALDTLSQPGQLKSVLGWVVATNQYGSPLQPQQPAIAQTVPAVTTKVSAPKQKPAKVELSEDEALEARKQGMNPEEYVYWRDRVHA